MHNCKSLHYDENEKWKAMKCEFMALKCGLIFNFPSCTINAYIYKVCKKSSKQFWKSLSGPISADLKIIDELYPQMFFNFEVKQKSSHENDTSLIS